MYIPLRRLEMLLLPHYSATAAAHSAAAAWGFVCSVALHVHLSCMCDCVSICSIWLAVSHAYKVVMMLACKEAVM